MLNMENITNEQKIQNLFLAARNAREAGDDATAIRHYEEITVLMPNSWEALFYISVLKTNTIKYGEINNAAIRVANCLPKVFELINETVVDAEEKRNVIKEVKARCVKVTTWLIDVSGKYYNELTQSDFSLNPISAAMNLENKRKEKYESANRSSNIGKILCLCGNYIEKVCDMSDDFYRDLAVDCWKGALAVHFGHIQYFEVAVYTEESVQSIANKILQYEPGYVVPNIKSNEKATYAAKVFLIILAALGVGFLIALPLF